MLYKYECITVRPEMSKKRKEKKNKEIIHFDSLIVT